MTRKGSEIGVIGAGSWGTAFARYLAGIKHLPVTMWAREPEVVESINERHENTLYLPDVALPENLRATASLEEAVRGAQILVIGVPSKFCPSLYPLVNSHLNGDCRCLISLTKGLDEAGTDLLSRLMAKSFPSLGPSRIAVLSGPSFARELAKDHPTAVVIASAEEATAVDLQHSFSSSVLRIYHSTDVVGVELGGALKNIIAIAAGVVSGMGFGYNTLASMITRGNIEILRLGLKLGACEETFLGLSGIGDLMLTCFGPLSRNRTFGERIGKGESMEAILKGSVSVVEGLTTVKTALKLSEKWGVEMPITKQIHGVLYEGQDLKVALKELMGRSLKKEWNVR